VPPQLRVPPIDPGRIDWAKDPEALRRGDMGGLAPELMFTLNGAVGQPEIQALAARLGVPPMAVVLALVAWFEADGNRHAARVFRAVLGNEPPEVIAAAHKALGW
jgi:hypothetical protein